MGTPWGCVDAVSRRIVNEEISGSGFHCSSSRGHPGAGRLFDRRAQLAGIDVCRSNDGGQFGRCGREGAGFTRPKVESSGNVTVAVEEPPHDYNNNTGAANNFSNSQVTGLTIPGPFYTTSDLKLRSTTT